MGFPIFYIYAIRAFYTMLFTIISISVPKYDWSPIIIWLSIQFQRNRLTNIGVRITDRTGVDRTPPPQIVFDSAFLSRYLYCHWRGV